MKLVFQTPFGQKFLITINILNNSHISVKNNKITNELWKNRPTSIKKFKVFGRKHYININQDNIGKIDCGVYEGIFLGKSSKRKGYKSYKK